MTQEPITYTRYRVVFSHQDQGDGFSEWDTTIDPSRLAGIVDLCRRFVKPRRVGVQRIQVTEAMMPPIWEASGT